MKLRQSQSAQLKTKLSSTLRSWLPILQAGLEDLEDELKKYEEENPYLRVKSGFEEQFSLKSKNPCCQKEHSGNGDVIEAISVYEKSIYELLYEQINAPLFPTPKSETVAYAIIENISTEGYFEGDIAAIADKCDVDVEYAERIRQRFANLDPAGVGALDVAESMLFQLMQSYVEEPLYSLVFAMLKNFNGLRSFKMDPLYNDALDVIRRFKNPPAIETMQSSSQAIPDLFIYERDGGIEVHINDDFYPEISIYENKDDHPFVKQKIKEAQDLIDALGMRRATLYKVGLMIVEFQYDFFKGGDIRPMKLKDIAEEFDHNPSTISRAIANKYIMCDRGLLPMKAFFSTGIDEDVSSAAIKEYIYEIISKEDRSKPFSDNSLLAMIEKKFGVKLVRRTVTKYRKQLHIGGSSERKRFYQLA